MEKLTPQGCRERRERLLSAVPTDLIILNNPRHIFYFTGLFLTDLLLSAWGVNALLIDGGSGGTTLLVHDSMGAQAGQAAVDEVVYYPWYVGARARTPGGDLFGAAAAVMAAHVRPYADRTVAAERGWLPHGVLASEPLDVNGAILALRRVKTVDELALIRESVRVNEAAHRAARAAVYPGATELDVYNAAHAAATLAYGGPVKLMGDFVSGERARQVGGDPTGRTLASGEVMIVDMFPVVNGYRADFTATLAVDEQVSAAQRRLDAALHDALAAGEALLRPGALAGDVYHAVRAGLGEFGAHFPHHAGHGLGLDHPEAPYFVPESTEVLQAGDVVTLEPGAYGDDFAGRIEHNYRITDTSFERLTAHSTALLAEKVD